MIFLQGDVSRQQVDDHFVLKCHLVGPRKLDDRLMDSMAGVVLLLLYFKHTSTYGSINSQVEQPLNPQP